MLKRFVYVNCIPDVLVCTIGHFKIKFRKELYFAFFCSYSFFLCVMYEHVPNIFSPLRICLINFMLFTENVFTVQTKTLSTNIITRN